MLYNKVNKSFLDGLFITTYKYNIEVSVAFLLFYTLIDQGFFLSLKTILCLFKS